VSLASRFVYDPINTQYKSLDVKVDEQTQLFVRHP